MAGGPHSVLLYEKAVADGEDYPGALWAHWMAKRRSPEPDRAPPLVGRFSVLGSTPRCQVPHQDSVS